MKISKVSVSRLNSTNFTDLKFGTVFSDHIICKYIDGEWGELEIKPYGPLDMNPGSQILHYGHVSF